MLDGHSRQAILRRRLSEPLRSPHSLGRGGPPPRGPGRGRAGVPPPRAPGPGGTHQEEKDRVAAEPLAPSRCLPIQHLAIGNLQSSICNGLVPVSPRPALRNLRSAILNLEWCSAVPPSPPLPVSSTAPPLPCPPSPPHLRRPSPRPRVSPSPLPLLERRAPPP